MIKAPTATPGPHRPEGPRCAGIVRAAAARIRPLLPASLLFAILTSVAITTALAGFGAGRAAAAHRRLAASRARRS
jgi:hypothetical protein